MFGKGIRLFSLLGFEVRIDFSWLFLAALVAWSLARGLFPYYVPGLSPLTYWLMGAGGVVGLLVSIVLHEFCHSLVARRYGLPIGGISLFLFGGVAQMEEEPPSAKSEFLMAVAGPASSMVLAGLFHLLEGFGEGNGWPIWLVGLLFYLAYLNLVLAIFNLMPAYPLDGGRMLRAALWGWRDDLHGATRLAAAIGRGFGFVLIVLGVASVLNGFVVSGLWWALIGMFVRAAAENSYRQLVIREGLAGRPVRRFMSPAPVTVEPAVTLRHFFDDYVARHHHRLYPVTEGERLVGYMTLAATRGVPMAEWERHAVREFMRAVDDQTSIAAGADATRALALMLRTGNSRLVVTEEGRLAGVLTFRDLMK